MTTTTTVTTMMTSTDVNCFQIQLHKRYMAAFGQKYDDDDNNDDNATAATVGSVGHDDGSNLYSLSQTRRPSYHGNLISHWHA